MRTLRTVILTLLLFSVAAFGQSTTVTGNFKDVISNSLSGNAFLRIRLRNYSGSAPTVTGTGILVKTQVDVSPDSTGTISTTLYGNDQITPLGTYYQFQYWNNGRMESAENFQVLSTTAFNFNTAIPLVTIPSAPLPELQTPAAGVGTELQYRNSVTGGFAAVTGSSVSGGSINLSGTGQFTVTAPYVIDFSGAAHTLPSLVGLIANLPATCTTGEQYFATDATAGANIYGCVAPNTWAVESGGGGGGSVGGSGTANYVARWSGTSTLTGDSTLQNVGTSWQFGIPISFSGVAANTPIISNIPANAAVVPNFNANFLQGCNWASACALGTVIPADGHFVHLFATDLTLSGSGDFDLQAQGLVTELPNDAAGTVANEAVCLTSSGTAVSCANSAAKGVLGICDPRDSGATCGTTGTAHVVRDGQVTAVFDSASAITAGDFVAVSAAAAPKLTDVGANYPATQQAVGMALASAVAGSTVNILVFGQTAPLGVSATGTPANGNLAQFSGPNTVSNGDLTGDTTTSGTLHTALAAPFMTRSCEIHIWGTGASSVLQDTDDEVVSCKNVLPVTETITGVSCWANAGSPTITPILTGGAANSILTGALTCGTAAWANGTLNGTPTLTTGSTIDDNITTAGGVATNIRIVITFSLPHQ